MRRLGVARPVFAVEVDTLSVMLAGGMIGSGPSTTTSALGALSAALDGGWMCACVLAFNHVAWRWGAPAAAGMLTIS